MLNRMLTDTPSVSIFKGVFGVKISPNLTAYYESGQYVHGVHSHIGQDGKTTYGELFDLKNDPQEVNTLWDKPAYAVLKQELLRKYIRAELAKEPMRTPWIAGA